MLICGIAVYRYFMPKTSVYINKRNEQLWRKFKEISKREGRSFSLVLEQLVFAYVKEHEKGNPQKPLLPAYEKPLYVVSQFPMERRYDNVEWLKSLIARNPGKSEIFWMHKFAILAGLRPETVAGYIKNLLISKEVVRKKGGLYVTEQVSP